MSWDQQLYAVYPCTYYHCNDVIVSAMASQATNFTIVYLTVYSGADQRKHESSTSLAFVREIHRWPVNSRTKGQQRGKCFHLMTSSCSKWWGQPWWLLMWHVDDPLRTHLRIEDKESLILIHDSVGSIDTMVAIGDYICTQNNEM